MLDKLTQCSPGCKIWLVVHKCQPQPKCIYQQLKADTQIWCLILNVLLHVSVLKYALPSSTLFFILEIEFSNILVEPNQFFSLMFFFLNIFSPCTIIQFCKYFSTNRDFKSIAFISFHLNLH